MQWFRELEQGRDICTVFLDYSKAFDIFPHRPLLQMLQNYGVHQHSLHIIFAHVLNTSVQTVHPLIFYLCHMECRRAQC